MKRKLSMLVVAIVTVGSLVACGSASDSKYSEAVSTSSAPSYEEYASDGFYAYESEAMAEAPAEISENGGETIVQQNTSRKIIYTSSINVETLNYDEDVASLKSLVKTNGGYFESANENGNYEYNNRYGSFTIRVPVNKYSSFMEAIGNIGSVTSKSEDANDVTSQYVDVEARIAGLETKRERLEELEAKAETLEDLLEIEDRIADVQYELESYTRQLKALDDKIDYCTIHVSLDEVAVYTPVEEATFFEQVADAFVSGWSIFVTFIEELIIGIIYMLPFIIILAIILVVFFKRRKKNKNTNGSESKVQTIKNSSENTIDK